MKVQPISDDQAAEIAEWRYEFPYEWYDTSADPRRVELFANPARIVDAYAGSGATAIPLAHDGRTVVAIELDRPAVDRMRPQLAEPSTAIAGSRLSVTSSSSSGMNSTILN